MSVVNVQSLVVVGADPGQEQTSPLSGMMPSTITKEPAAKETEAAAAKAAPIGPNLDKDVTPPMDKVAIEIDPLAQPSKEGAAGKSGSTSAPAKAGRHAGKRSRDTLARDDAATESATTPKYKVGKNSVMMSHTYDGSDNYLSNDTAQNIIHKLRNIIGRDNPNFAYNGAHEWNGFNTLGSDTPRAVIEPTVARLARFTALEPVVFNIQREKLRKIKELDEDEFQAARITPDRNTYAENRLFAMLGNEVALHRPTLINNIPQLSRNHTVFDANSLFLGFVLAAIQLSDYELHRVAGNGDLVPRPQPAGRIFFADTSTAAGTAQVIQAPTLGHINICMTNLTMRQIQTIMFILSLDFWYESPVGVDRHIVQAVRYAPWTVIFYRGEPINNILWDPPVNAGQIYDAMWALARYIGQEHAPTRAFTVASVILGGEFHQEQVIAPQAAPALVAAPVAQPQVFPAIPPIVPNRRGYYNVALPGNPPQIVQHRNAALAAWNANIAAYNAAAAAAAAGVNVLPGAAAGPAPNAAPAPAAAQALGAPAAPAVAAAAPPNVAVWEDAEFRRGGVSVWAYEPITILAHLVNARSYIITTDETQVADDTAAFTSSSIEERNQLSVIMGMLVSAGTSTMWDNNSVIGRCLTGIVQNTYPNFATYLRNITHTSDSEKNLIQRIIFYHVSSFSGLVITPTIFPASEFMMWPAVRGVELWNMYAGVPYHRQPWTLLEFIRRVPDTWGYPMMNGEWDISDEISLNPQDLRWRPYKGDDSSNDLADGLFPWQKKSYTNTCINVACTGYIRADFDPDMHVVIRSKDFTEQAAALVNPFPNARNWDPVRNFYEAGSFPHYDWNTLNSYVYTVPAGALGDNWRRIQILRYAGREPYRGGLNVIPRADAVPVYVDQRNNIAFMFPGREITLNSEN